MSPRTLIVDHSHSEKSSSFFQMAPLSQRKNSCSVSLGILLHKHYSASFSEGRKTDSFSLCFNVTQVLNPDLASLIRASQNKLVHAHGTVVSQSFHNSETELSAITWDSIRRILKPAPWNLFPIIPSNRHIIWNPPFLITICVNRSSRFHLISIALA